MYKRQVYGEKGTLVVDEYAEQAVQIKLHDPVVTRTSFTVPKLPLNTAGEVDAGVSDAFLDAILCGKYNRADWVWSRNAVELCDTAWRSALEKKERAL